MIGIYQIQSKVKPERSYVGSAVNIENRWYEHLKKLKRNKHHSKKLQNHFNKYGIGDLQFSVITGCDKDDLITLEQFFIDSYNPWFNICKKAGNTLGVKGAWSEESRRRFSEYRKNNSRGAKNGFYGKHHTEDALIKMRGPKAGKQTPRPWMSERMRGTNNSNAKLTETKIREILAKIKTGKYKYRELAEEYGVCSDTIYRINREHRGAA